MRFVLQAARKKLKRECNTRTSQEVTHPSTTLAQARLTSEFYPTPATAHFTGTCWYIYHINPIKPCWCLGLCSYSWVWWNFEKYFKLPCHITNHFLKKNSKKINSKPIFFLLLVAHLENGAPLISLIFFISPPLDLKSPVS